MLSQQRCRGETAFREPLLSPAQLSLEYVQAGPWEWVQHCTDITDEVEDIQIVGLFTPIQRSLSALEK